MTILEKTLRWIALAGVFALPFVCLLVTSSLFFPYITGKNFAFRIIVEISVAAWLALALVNPAYRPRRSWVLAALAVFVAIIGLADILGEYPFKSIWSNYERMDGWVTIAHLLAYTVVAASMLQTEKLWRWLWWTTLGVSAYLAVYGLFQVTGQIALGQGGAAGLSGRIDATFGNPIYFAAYMLFHIFLAAMLWAQQWVEKGQRKRVGISLAYGSIIVFDTIALLLTGTRGAILGLVGGALLAALLVLVQASHSRNAWRAAAAMVVGLLVLIGGFFMVKDQAWVQRIGFLQRLATISLDDATTKARFINWSMAWQGVQEKPILGWGQENYALVFDKYYDPRMHSQEPWFDRVHNIVFDWWVAGGTLGLLAYLSIFVAALSALLFSRGFSIAERSILVGLLAGYFVHNFFVFDNVTSYILFGTVLAFIAYRASKARDAKALWSGAINRTYLPYVATLSALALLFAAWGINQKPLAANKLLLQALAPQGQPATNLDFMRQSIELGTFGMQEAREQLAQMAAQASQMNIPDDTKRQFFELAASEMRKQEDMSPLDARFPLFLGVLYGAYDLHDDAKAAYERALADSPKKQAILIQLAENAVARGDTAASLAYYKQAHELETDFPTAAVLYGSALILSGETEQAEAVLAPYIERGQAADTRLLAAYRSTNQLARSVPVWEAAIRTNPQDAQLYFTLAAIHYLSGNRTAAVAALEDAKRAIPGIAGEADTVIEQIRTGTAEVL